ncbi:uncharacterized protein B0H18DRAFT_981894 [Fomitopsis serialis]|uniref:uncharacterized protein n=1 Tax=Fomitopsis serialis TaxID=139415 RepID=UPI0020086618|nr:uncharacterized protein B0H18DRAFT_981894 [Neoantrodia serialis]KAH9933757.1 hypothetical protein B0H18DRAFT_981894 [Neoantrodia serialis]
MRHRDCEILITCDGKALDEYNVEAEDNVIECYVASESGQTFEIKCSNHSSAFLVMRTAVDGRPFPRPKSTNAGDTNVTLRCEHGVDKSERLMFERLCITDDDAAAKVLSHGDHLGLIEVCVARAIRKEDRPWKASSITARNIGPIHETAKKGGMHCVSFGDTQPYPIRKTIVDVTYIDKWTAPYITFKFRYRPHAILQAQGIVEAIQPPRSGPSGSSSRARDTPSPAPPQAASSVSRRERQDDASQSEPPRKRLRRDGTSSSSESGSRMEDLLRADDTEDAKPLRTKGEDDDGAESLNALEAQMEALRQKIDRARAQNGQGSQFRVVKREPSPILVGHFNGGIIDLTED